jgi:hypothetical protein
LGSEVGIVQDLHGLQGDPVEEACILNASLIDGAKGTVSGSSGKADAESPTGLVDFNSALVCAFLEFSFTLAILEALSVLVWASFIDALFELIILGHAEGEEAEEDKDNVNEFCHKK